MIEVSLSQGIVSPTEEGGGRGGGGRGDAPLRENADYRRMYRPAAGAAGGVLWNLIVWSYEFNPQLFLL